MLEGPKSHKDNPVVVSDLQQDSGLAPVQLELATRKALGLVPESLEQRTRKKLRLPPHRFTT
jgi:hypothetical protein